MAFAFAAPPLRGGDGGESAEMAAQADVPGSSDPSGQSQ